MPDDYDALHSRWTEREELDQSLRFAALELAVDLHKGQSTDTRSVLAQASDFAAFLKGS